MLIERGSIVSKNDSNENTGMRLLKKWQRGLINVVFSRVGIMSLLLIGQFVILLLGFVWFNDFLPHVYGGSTIFGLVMVIYLINSDHNPTAKITWLAIIVFLPIFGIALYAFTESDLGHRKVRDRLKEMVKETGDLLPPSEDVIEDISRREKGAASLCKYLYNRGKFPTYNNMGVKYFKSGEAKFEELLIQLEKAESFIFLEYFIIDEGLMWGKVLDILAQKAKEGVDVRVMYDGTCEFSSLSHDYPKRLKKLGIKCEVFAPITPFVSTHYNYRDHRKILVIDGHTAFTGGINLADEYINKVEKYGHWKDTAIMIKGPAVKSFTLMFLQNWSNKGKKEPAIEKYLQWNEAKLLEGSRKETSMEDDVRREEVKEQGYIVPYGDCPLDGDKIGERVYMDILNRSQKYVHIMSPYLILDSEMETAIKFAAERGVDVKIILPGIPDKKIPYALAKTHYRTLIGSGVKLYEYTPGFVHAKVFVSDDIEGVVGTINLDYRSLYHHFECGAYMYDTECIPHMEEDFQETLSKCRKVTEETIKREKLIVRMVGYLMKGFAPLM